MAIAKLSSSGNILQKRWIERVEKRLKVTSSMLSEMKAVKMLGLSQVMFNVVDRLQRIEVDTSRRFRVNLNAQIFFCECCVTNSAPALRRLT